MILAISFIRDKTQSYFYIQGFAGIKKTSLYNVLCHYNYIYKKVVFHVALSTIILI